MAKAGLLLIVAAGWAGSASAQAGVSEVGTVAVDGSVAPACVLQEARLAAGGLVNFRGLNGDTLQIANLIDPTTLAANAASASVEFDAVCNFPHRVRLESQNNGLWQTDGSQVSPADGFAYALPYRAMVTWGAVNGNLFADANVRRITEQRFNIDQPTGGSLMLDIAIEAGASNVRTNAPVLAGVYGDTIRIFLEPR